MIDLFQIEAAATATSNTSVQTKQFTLPRQLIKFRFTMGSATKRLFCGINMRENKEEITDQEQNL